jgi:hypothetical protein
MKRGNFELDVKKGLVEWMMFEAGVPPSEQMGLANDYLDTLSPPYNKSKVKEAVEEGKRYISKKLSKA